jgi:tRNA pseudouridine synthase 9
MERGAIMVNGKPVESGQHIIKNGDVISHTLHRHEPPVTGLPIGVLHEDDDMIVINKPAGVPVHPAGRYNYNSVIEIMRAERGHSFNPLPCNRLDRLTSGVMFIGKHAKAAADISLQISERTVRKEYVARVKGEFPEGEVVCDMPLLQISPKLGLNRVRANGKAAQTVFKRLAYYPDTQVDDAHSSRGALRTDARASTGLGRNVETPENFRAGEGQDLNDHDNDHQDGAHTKLTGEARPWVRKEGYSIVRCLPITGRTHQLRVHLQHLGHPISNDPIYCNQRVWGATLGANDADASRDSDEDIITRLSRMGKSEVADAVAYHDEMVDEYNKKKAEKMSGELCTICDTPLYTDPGVQELGIYLHSLRYEDAGGAWSYVSPLPAWALPPQGYSGPTEVGGLEELVAAVQLTDPGAASVS